jgi:hypothetical protein
MSLPKVSIVNLNGQLGQQTPSADGVTGIVMCGVAVAGKIALAESHKLNALADAVALGLDATYDTTNTTNVYKTISDFYKDGDGPELWIMIVANTTLMATMCDVTSAIVTKLLNDSGRTIRLVGVTRVPIGSYAPAYVNQLDPDVLAAALKAEALAVQYETEMAPVRFVIDCRDFQGTVASLVTLKTNAYRHVRICMWTDVSGSKNAAIGRELGRLAVIPVQRNMGRVKDGNININNAYLTGQSTTIDSLSLVQQDGIYDKGFGTVRKFPGKTGWFIADDITATADTDDYNRLSRGRTIDKARIITNLVFVNEILDDLEIDENGFIDAGIVKTYQSNIKKALDAQMTINGEISSARSIIDPKQNILSTNLLNVAVKVIPKGTNKEIDITLGFLNPLNQ